MAEEENKEEYKLVKEGGSETTNSSREFTGRGTAFYKNSEMYEGEFKEGIREGKGKYLYLTGDEYEGDFKANLKHGIGKMAYKGKGEYYGYWENGKRHGEGVFTYANKDVYSGWWKYGQKEGPGTYTFADTGMKFVGTWSQSQFIRGRWVFPNGTLYEGEFEKNKPNGKGKWVFKSGNSLEGKYSQQTIEEETPEGDKKLLTSVSWKTNSEIVKGSECVNSHEEFA